MFKNRKLAAQVTLVKAPKTDDTTRDENKIFTPDAVKLITERSKDVVKFVALAAIGVYAAVKTIDTVSEIAIKKTKSADNNEK